MSCEQCPGRHFLGKKELDRHKREKHDKTTLFYCPDINCKRHREGFPRKSNCDRHIKLQHRNITLRALDSTVDSSENPTSPAQSNENWSSNVPEANPLDLGGEAVNDSETGFGERAKRPRIEDVTYLRAENSKLRERNAQLEKELQGLRYKYEERGNIVRMLSGRDVSRF
ncbi:hypothetical protein F5Y04DRAFT_58113 [Hypomontagnella monticulosa]|nr:hypothetical protein F5Y04DRAFT_58113 [Hypomontagnella monticulosa]